MVAKEFKEEVSWDLQVPREDKAISSYIFVQPSAASIRAVDACTQAFPIA
jgi:hypothetical protein